MIFFLLKRKKYFYRIFVTFLAIFLIKKTCVEANLNVAAVFTQQFVHNSSFCDNCVSLVDL